MSDRALFTNDYDTYQQASYAVAYYTMYGFKVERDF